MFTTFAFFVYGEKKRTGTPALFVALVRLAFKERDSVFINEFDYLEWTAVMCGVQNLGVACDAIRARYNKKYKCSPCHYLAVIKECGTL
ncbi:MAG: hypothetical protein DRP74_02205 [Candidatus Omnitrophota bacterium]|nr:MAG: hypothetical protein DRP74_02205 [Candidatus Omnitrophota bacterium]